MLEEGLYLRYTRVYSIELLMESSWIQQHLSGMEDKVRDIECALFQDPASVLTDMIRPAEGALLGEIESELGRARITGCPYGADCCSC